MAVFLAPIINDQQQDANGNPLSGGTIEVYLAGTSTPSTTYSDKAGLAPNTWPIVLNTLGVNNQGSIWITGGSSYKFIIKNSVGVVQRTIDSVSGINDTAVAVDQWIVFQGTPTFVSATSFTLAGDQTQTFQVGRRIKTQNTGGLVYSTITASAYVAPNTTVTVRNDSGVLDAGLSQVSYGIISVINSSVTGLLLSIQTFNANATYTPNPGATRLIVVGIGSGGAGGGCAALGAGQVSVGGGGASGARGIASINSGFFPSVGVTIGAGGSGSPGGTGGTGGASAFGGFLTLPGGAGGVVGAAGAVSAASGGSPAVAGGSALLFTSSGTTGEGAISSFAAGWAKSGAGGSTEYGSGGQANVTGGPTSGGVTATGRGGGGSGAAGVAAGAAAAGGNGAAGVIIVYEYA